MTKIYDCITFFQENFITNLRFEILDEVVDYFVVCESKYNHRGEKKRLNFNLLNPKFESKIIYLVLNENFKEKNLWKNQAVQREYIFNGLRNAGENDYVMFSDPDEIPNPEMIKRLNLTSKYGIFLQNCFCYKLNIFNEYETPWEGTRICKKKNLKSFDYLRQKILKKNLKKSFLKFYIEKNIQLIQNGGWHFNSLLSPEEISKKLKTFAHEEYASDKFSDIEVIKKKIRDKKDLFDRGNEYKKIKIDNSYPKYIINNLEKFKNWID